MKSTNSFRHPRPQLRGMPTCRRATGDRLPVPFTLKQLLTTDDEPLLKLGKSRVVCISLQLGVLGLSLLLDGDVGVGVFPAGEKRLQIGSRYCGSPTFRTNSANRGSERMGSSKKSVFKPSSKESRS